MTNIYGLDFNLLKGLNALLVTASVSEAATRVGVSQPAMSATLRKLRELYGDPLLVRRGNRMLPTPLARRLAPVAAEAMSHVRSTLAFADRPFDPRELEATVRIATTDEIVATLAPALLRELSCRAPKTKVAFKPLTPAYNLTDLELGRLDLVVTVDWTVPAQLRRARLFADEFCCVAAAGHPLAGSRLTPEIFAAQRHALVAPLGGAWGPVDDALADLGLARTVAVTVPTFSLVSMLLEEDRSLLCTLPRRAADVVLPGDAWVRFEPPIKLRPIRYDLFWHERAQADPVHRWVRTLLRELARGDGETS